MKKIDWLIIFSFLAISLYTLKDLYKPGFYTSHDGPHQIVRLYYFDQAIRDGQLPPRWAGGLLNGFGYPLFIFSYHFPWFMAELMHVLGLSIIDSVKMTFLVGFFLSGITMYFFQREIFGRLSAIVGVIIYLFAPYRFSNIFVRAAIGDATIFIFPPLLFLSLYKLKRSKILDWRWITLGSVSLAGILLSHAMVFLFFFLSFLLYMLFFSFFAERKKSFVGRGILITLLSFGLASYYFIPSLLERNLTKFTQTIKSVYYGATFLNLNKLFYSPWGYGTIDAKEGSMSLQLGIAQWMSVVLSFLTILFLRSGKRKTKSKTELLKESAFYFILFVASISLMLPISSLFWKFISNIALIDFTWRVLPVSIFTVSILAGFVVSQMKYRWVIAVILVILALYGNRNHLRINQTLDWSLSFYLQLERTTNSYDEYTPKWVRNELVAMQKPKVEFSNNSAQINILKSTSNYLEFNIESSESGVARINTIYYPGWRAFVDGKPSDIKYDNGLIELEVPKGKSRVISQFKETPLRKVSDLLTLATIGVITLGFVKYLIPPRR